MRELRDLQFSKREAPHVNFKQAFSRASHSSRPQPTRQKKNACIRERDMVLFVLSTEESALVRGGFFRRSRENKGKNNMKQLKFMLAAATAIGLATAAQADTSKLIDNENFENRDVGTLGRELTGWSYSDPANAEQDDDSRVELDGSNKALKVNTGTKPLLRHLNDDAGTAVDMTAEGFESLYIDTMVQFTVTPDGETPEVSKDADGNVLDKLMIYLQEVPEVKNEEGTVTTPATTKLKVKCGKIKTVGAQWNVSEQTCTVEDYTVEPNKWYRLVVTATIGEKKHPHFTIQLGRSTDSALTSITATEEPTGKFASLKKSDSSLTYVGFAGEGMVDDLTVATITTATSVDFTLKLSWGDGFSGVTYTIDNGEAQTPVNGGDITVEEGKTLKIDYVLEDWYKIVGTPVLEYTAADDVTETLALAAEKAANVDSEGNVEITTDTTPADVYVSGGSFASVATEEDVAKLNKALTWAKKVAGKTTASAAGALVSELNFADGDETEAEAAYLLNCDPSDADALKDAKDNFKFEAFDPETFDAVNVANWVQSVREALNGKGYNGTVEIHGATTLEKGGDWAKDKPGAFYKAVLTK